MAEFQLSEFQKVRQSYQPILPNLLKNKFLSYDEQEVSCKEQIKNIFPTICSKQVNAVVFKPSEESQQSDYLRTPLRVGVVLSGGQAAGGHNVISGIYDFIKQHHENSQIFGFLDGPHGIFSNKYVEITENLMNLYRNQGGFDMIGSGRHKIETADQFENSLKSVTHLDLHGLVVIGGDDSNTNACLLAEYFAKNGCSTKVIGAPKTIDGDLKNEYIDISFGFDTACKVYSEQVGNICTDCVSSKKYYHFIRLMGRSASHITLECALQTRPTAACIGEEVQQKNISLQKQVEILADIIVKRASKGKNYGVILVPEGLIEFFPDVNKLIGEINEILSKPQEGDDIKAYVIKNLGEQSRQVFEFLPLSIQEQFLLDRDPHGNVQVAKIDTEKLLVLLLQQVLEVKQKDGEYKGNFKPQTHYFGYEGRCALPSNFDSNYCYGLGHVAGALIQKGFTGYMSTLRNLKLHPSEWIPAGVPLVTMMHIERRKGKDVPVIAKALVEMDSHIFKTYEQIRDHWALNDCFRNPGPIQFEGPLANDQTFLIKQLPFEAFGSPEDDANAVQYAERKTNNLSELEQLRFSVEAPIPKIFENNTFKVIKQQQHFIEDQDFQQAVHKSYPLYKNSKQYHSFIEFAHAVKENEEEIVLNDKNEQLNIAVVFNGRQSPGGNNVVDGLIRFARNNQNVKLYGFLNGTKGMFQQKYIEITEENFKLYRNQGGYDFLGRSADKCRDPQELEATKLVCEKLNLNGLVFIGATHTLTDTLILQEYFLEKGCNTVVVAVPATIDGNIKYPQLESTVGFDTATKIYSQLIGNNMTDAASAKKYWYFMRLMGKDPSHLILECALQTHPNCTLISEEFAQNGQTLEDIVNYICDIICQRAANKKNFGTVLIPEGLLAHLPFMKQLIVEINEVFKNVKSSAEQQELGNQLFSDSELIKQKLTPWSAAFFLSLPDFTRKQLLLERESLGGVQLSQIETENLISYLVGQELKKRKSKGTYKGSFSAVTHFLGYQGRCGLPTRFDCSLASTYGYTAAVVIQHGLRGYCVGGRGLLNDPSQWTPTALPLISILQFNIKQSFVADSATVPSQYVNLKSKAFQHFKNEAKKWISFDHYSNPGPIQFYQDDYLNLTSEITYKDHLNLVRDLNEQCQQLQNLCNMGVSEEVLRVAVQSLKSLNDTLNLFKNSLKN